MTDMGSAPAGGPTAFGRRLDGMPDFVVIGAQKSASTFLQDQLDLHPEIEIAEGEVRHFEDPFYGEGAVDLLPQLFTRPVGEALRGIKRPDYLGRPEIPARLHERLPDARLLVVLREPVARAVSGYYHFVRHGFVPLLPVDEAFTALLAGDWVERYPRSSEVLSFGLYGEHLRRWTSLYAADRVLVFDQQTLVRQRQESLRTAFAFLGVDPDHEVPEQANTVSNKGVYAPLRLRLLRTKNRTRYRYSPSLDRRFPRKMTPWGIAYNAAVTGLDRVVLSRFDEGRPAPLSPDVHERVADFYRSDATVLREVLGESLQASWL